mmetsp:Transcript_41217/g.123181  ORF Transcript_41217/g.123181 Transcript_41217/m.123181 type:complete len:719 (-) Transcript_41217:275-2431(-)
MSVRQSPTLTPCSPQRVRHRGPTIDTGGNTPVGIRADRPDHVVHTPPNSAPPTPRSTLGSPLTVHAIRRSGAGDLGAGPRRSARRRISLSDVEVLPWLCCMAPAIDVFGSIGVATLSVFFFPTVFYFLLATLTLISCAWMLWACLATIVAIYWIRQATKENWHEMFEEVQQVDPVGSTTLHIVILPNYKENERMLMETLVNLGRSPLAATRMRVVLAMEAREGPAAHEKANHLIQQASHLFADMFATFHPEGLPGELPGKSSNTQWAYREAVRHYGPILVGFDLSRVFLTVGDADTIWHPQYFSALAYSGMMMSEQERVWKIWQPPVMLLRNIFNVPIMTRCSAYATLIFELFFLTTPKSVLPAFAYSAYSLTLALALHPEVDGWDVDVIAEDHHMFCKCFFASLWEQAHASKDGKKAGKEGTLPAIEPQVQIEPIFLPAVSYLVESSEGYWPSVWARFHQARRHMQGVVEFGYILLQYMKLIKEVGMGGLPKTTHWTILKMVLKIHIVQIQTSVQCWATAMGVLAKVIPAIAAWVWAGGLVDLFRQNAFLEFDMARGGFVKLILTSVQSFSGVVLLFTILSAVVVLDLMQGRYHQCLPIVAPSRMLPVAEGDDDNAAVSSSKASSPVTGNQSHSSPQRTQESLDTTDEPPEKLMPSFVEGPIPFMRKLGLYALCMSDTLLCGYVTVIFYATIPTVLAAWSLVVRGTDFEYIVAVKPE